MDDSQKVLNALAARLTKVEMLLENNDVYAPPGAVSLADLSFGPEVQVQPDFNQFMQWDPQFASTVGQFDPFQFQATTDEERAENDGFTASQAAIDALYDRLEALETALSNGSKDTDQDDAQAAGQETGDDGLTGSQDPVAVALSGLGTMSLQNYNNVAITGGSISTLTNAATTWTFTTMALTASSTAALTGSSITLTTATGGSATNVAMTSNTITLTTSGSTTLIDSGSSVGLSNTSKTTSVSGSSINIGQNASSTYLNLGNSSGGTLSFFNAGGTTKQTITGSRGGNAALASLLTALQSHGLLTDSTT